MALINCRECGQTLSDAANICPHCGAPQNRPSNSKDKIVAALLALFLGSLGIHFFYLEKTTAGIVTIILSICSCGIWSVLMFIQGIYMLTISEEEFYNKYVNSASTLPLF